MFDKILNYLIGAACFALLAVVIARMQTSGPMAFLMIFGISAIAALLFLASNSPDREMVPPEDNTPLPAGFGRALLEKMPSPLMLISDRGLITYFNPAAAQLVPRLRGSGHFANLFRAPVFVETVTEVMKNGVAAEVKFSLPGQDRVFLAQVGRVPPGGDLGEDSQVLVQIEDRTEERRMDQMRSDFIANASHELRTPLSSIIGYIETLQGHARDDPQARDRFLGIMEKQASRMNRLVEDLMSLSRIEMNVHHRPSEKCDIHAIVLEAGAALQPAVEKAEAELKMRLVPGMKTVVGDHDQLMQIATNLIDNGLKYGGGFVEVSEARSNDKYPRMVGISVADHGQGISREHLHRLTERFYRTDVAQSRNVGGTGLGLAIVKHILNRHGGELQIESTEGKGSRFTFWVPEFNKAVTKDTENSLESENT